MPPYRKPGEVNWTPTKYDDCTVKMTGHPYRHQEGSGRAAALALVTDGVRVGDLTKLAAEHGFDSGFVVGSLLKQMGAKDHAFDIVAPEGTTLDAIKATRQERTLSPEQAAARQAKLEAAEAKKAERAKLAEQKAQERAEAKQKADEERRAKKEAAAKAAAEAKAAAAAKAAEGGGEGTTAPAAEAPKKGKGKAKAAAAQPEGESAAA